MRKATHLNWCRISSTGSQLLHDVNISDTPMFCVSQRLGYQLNPGDGELTHCRNDLAPLGRSRSIVEICINSTQKWTLVIISLLNSSIWICKIFLNINYPPEDEHGNETSTMWRCVSYWTWGFSTVMSVSASASNVSIHRIHVLVRYIHLLA